MRRLYWTGLCGGRRLEGMGELNRILDRYAIILHSQRFSDVALGLSLEVTGNRLVAFREALAGMMRVEGDAAPVTDSEMDWVVMLNVTFVEGTGNLEVEVPMVPG